MMIKLVAVSDTHGMHRELDIPEGDVFIHAGDLTRRGTIDDLIEFNEFLGSLQHQYKIVVAGNHDFCFEESKELAESLLTNAIYLQDEEVVIEGIKFYGSPWQPWFFDWAFNLQRGPQLREKWNRIPNNVDVLVTHGPPYGYCDETLRGDHVGCEELLAVVERIRPRVHIFGHIHESAGTGCNEWTTFINASSCDLSYRAVNAPMVYEFDVDVTMKKGERNR